MLVAEMLFKMSRNPGVESERNPTVSLKRKGKNGPISLQSCVHLTLTSGNFKKYNCWNLWIYIGLETKTMYSICLDVGRKTNRMNDLQ